MEEKKTTLDSLVQELHKKEDERRDDISLLKEEKIRSKAPLKTGIFVLSLIVFIGAAVWAYRAYQNPFPPPNAQEVEKFTRAALVDVADMLDAYRAEKGDLPESLGMLPGADRFGDALQTIQYTTQQGKYVLAWGSVENRTVTYRDGDDKKAFLKGD